MLYIIIYIFFVHISIFMGDTFYKSVHLCLSVTVGLDSYLVLKPFSSHYAMLCSFISCGERRSPVLGLLHLIYNFKCFLTFMAFSVSPSIVVYNSTSNCLPVKKLNKKVLFIDIHCLIQHNKMGAC
ncbi:hypothetical protein PHYPO_G00090190, partial [Pangasianodon hypophthalmus]